MSDPTGPLPGAMAPPPPPSPSPSPSPGSPPPPGWGQAADGRWYPPQPPGSTAPPGPGGYPVPPPAGATNTPAVVALIMGVLAILLSVACGLGSLFGVAALVFGVSGLRSAKGRPGGQGTGLAVAGIVTGAIGLVVSLLFVSVMVLGRSATQRFEEVGPSLEQDGGVNTDPSNGVCNPQRFLQDPDC